jgi:GNAT superfamily N-acetyltransferase
MIELKLVAKMADRLKWMGRFCKSYSGGLRPISLAMYSDPVRFLVAIDGDKELGFMRLYSTDEFACYTDDELWIIGEAYVKPAYRSKGVLSEMITLAVRDHSVKGLHIETSRFQALETYYVALDFTQVCTTDDPMLSHVFLSSLEQALTAANDDQFQQAA